MTRGVAACNFKGRGGNVRGYDPRGGQLMRQRNGDTPRAGSYIRDP